MRRALLIASVGLPWLLTPATAALYDIVLSGHVAIFDDGDYSYDENGFYGPPNGTLGGKAFTATFVVDDAAPGATFTSGPSSSSATGGPSTGGTSPISASLAIGGITVDLDALPFGSPVYDDGSLTKSIGPSGLTLSFSKYGGSPYGIDLNFNVAPLQAFASADFRDSLTTDLKVSHEFVSTGAPNGFVLLQGVFPNDPGGMCVPTSTSASLVAERLTITGPSAVPEPAGWSLMVLGMGLLGAALRCGPDQSRRTTFSR